MEFSGLLGDVIDSGWTSLVGREKKNKDIIDQLARENTKMIIKQREDTYNSGDCYHQKIVLTQGPVVSICDKVQQGRLGPRFKSRLQKRKVPADQGTEETLCLLLLRMNRLSRED